MLEYSNARPCEGRAFLLVNQNRGLLSEGLSHLLEAASELLTSAEQKGITAKLKKLQETPEFIFLFTLLNDQLVKAIEAEDYDRVKELFNQFSVPDVPDSFHVFSFNHNIIPKVLEQPCKDVLVSEFAEEATVHASNIEAFDRSKNHVSQAFKDIQKLSPEYFQECRALVSGVLILESKRFIAGSSFPLLGLVTLADKHDVPMTIDYLIHETAHQYLYNLMAMDEVVSGDGLFSSPLRKDPRPIPGIYHAVFVLARLVDFFKTALISPDLNKTHISPEFTAAQIKNYTERYYDGLALVEKHGRMTDLGQALLNSTKELVG